MYSLTVNDSICFDVYMTERRTRDNTWSLGHCFQSQEWAGPGTYTESCCLSKGVHTLTCKTSRANNDWSSNVVMVMGHRFCEDFVGYEAVFSINISGVFINGKISRYRYVCIHQFAFYAVVVELLVIINIVSW